MVHLHGSHRNKYLQCDQCGYFPCTLASGSCSLSQWKVGTAYNWTGNASGNDDAGANHDLEIAGEFNGYLDNLKWYNWSSSPVMTFTGSVTQMTVTVEEQNLSTFSVPTSALPQIAPTN